VSEVNGEIHVKGAHIQGAPYAVFKVATGFWKNPAQGLPSSSGLMMAFDATTGFPVDVTVAPDIEAALRNTDLVITTTPSREPLVHAG